MNAAAQRVAPTLISDPWRWLDAEGWYAALLKRLTGQYISAGDTTIATRMVHVRRLLSEHYLADKAMVPGSAETHRAWFLRLYGEPLESSQASLL